MSRLASLLQYRAAHKNPRLTNNVEGHQVRQFPIAIAHQIEGISILVNRFNITENKRGFRVQAKGFNRASDCAWIVEIIRIEPAYDLTCGFGKALVDAVCLTFVFSETHPASLGA